MVAQALLWVLLQWHRTKVKRNTSDTRPTPGVRAQLLHRCRKQLITQQHIVA